MDLDRDIAEYKRLSIYRDRVNERLEVLNKRIKKGIVEFTSLEGKEVTDECPGEYETEDGYKAKITVRTKTTFDPLRADGVFMAKKIFNKYAIHAIPEWALEEAYLQGDLDDMDLRHIKSTKRNLSLKVDEPSV